MHMKGRYTDYDNVEDFISHKLTRLIHDMMLAQRHDIVQVLQEALISYEDGVTDIAFREGWPYIVRDTHVEENNTPD